MVLHSPLTNKASVWTMNAKCTLNPNKKLDVYPKLQTKCFICEKSVFKVVRITPELIMMKCVNCGEIHMIGTTTNGEATVLTFWDSDAGPII